MNQFDDSIGPGAGWFVIPVFSILLAAAAIGVANYVPPLLQLLMDVLRGRDGQAEAEEERAMEGRLLAPGQKKIRNTDDVADQ